MASKKHRPEEAVAKLRHVDVLVSQGRSVAEAIRVFFEHRRWRHFGEPPEADDETLLDSLCEALRRRLTALQDNERAVILQHLARRGFGRQ
jgi:hypothetical protein